MSSVSLSSWLLFCWGLTATLLALNSLWPIARVWRHLVGPSFAMQLLASEQVPAQVAINAAGSFVLVHVGALQAWPGQVGLGAALLAVALQLLVVERAWRAQRVLVESLRPLGREAAQLVTLLRDHVQPIALASGPWTRIPDVVYGPAGHRNHLDIYVPDALTAPAPVLVWIHGGGWLIGDKRQQGRPLIEQFLAAGWICVAINYRLSPRVRFPAHLVDCKRALAWVHEHIGEHGGDPTRIVVAGGSAGAQLASLSALTQHEARYQPGFAQADTSVRACISLYGPYDVGAELTAGRGLWFVEHMARSVFGVPPWEDPEPYREASVIAHVHADAPPFFVLHGTADLLVRTEQAQRFVEALRTVSKNPVLYAELPGAMHAFDLMRSLRTSLVVQAILIFAEHSVGRR